MCRLGVYSIVLQLLTTQKSVSSTVTIMILLTIRLCQNFVVIESGSFRELAFLAVVMKRL